MVFSGLPARALHGVICPKSSANGRACIASFAATAVVQCFKQQLPEARQRPAAKLAIHARPFAKMLMEITPRDTPSAQSRKYHREQAGDLSERRPLRGPRSITNGSRQAQSSSLIKPPITAASLQKLPRIKNTPLENHLCQQILGRYLLPRGVEQKGWGRLAPTVNSLIRLL